VILQKCVTEKRVTAKHCSQTAVSKRSRRAGSKRAGSRMVSPCQMAVPAEVDVVLPQGSIPHIVLNLTGNEYPSVAELLKGSGLPPLVEVRRIFLSS